MTNLMVRGERGRWAAIPVVSFSGDCNLSGLTSGARDECGERHHNAARGGPVPELVHAAHRAIHRTGAGHAVGRRVIGKAGHAGCLRKVERYFYRRLLMQVQVHTDNHIQGRQELTQYVESVIMGAVDRYAEHLTHVEAHLGDVNSNEKSGSADKRCMLEARLAGVKTVAVHSQADNLHMAIDGAVEKLQHALDSSFGKLQDKQRRAQSAGHVSADVIERNPDSA
jgi:ribosome-associated translation inhibitor RaiA